MKLGQDQKPFPMFTLGFSTAALFAAQQLTEGSHGTSLEVELSGCMFQDPTGFYSFVLGIIVEQIGAIAALKQKREASKSYGMMAGRQSVCAATHV